jgi:hypothetical protein
MAERSAVVEDRAKVGENRRFENRKSDQKFCSQGNILIWIHLLLITQKVLKELRLRKSHPCFIEN